MKKIFKSVPLAVYILVGILCVWYADAYYHRYYASRSVSMRVGSLNGIPLAIPGNYIFLDFNYEGESAWEPKKIPRSQRTLQSPLSNFSLYVRWPNMEPFQRWNDENSASYDRSRRGNFGDGTNEWFVISVVNAGPNRAEGDKRVGNNGLARLLEGELLRLTRDYRISPRPPVDDKKYVFPSPSPSTFGLNKAFLKSQDHADEPVFNSAILWDGVRGKDIRTLISCNRRADGAEPGRCTQRFFMDELNSDVTITYDFANYKWVQHWPEIENKTRQLMLSFKVVRN